MKQKSLYNTQRDDHTLRFHCTGVCSDSSVDISQTATEDKVQINAICNSLGSLLTSVYLLTPVLHHHLQLLYVLNGFVHTRQGTVEQGTSATSTRADGLKIGLVWEKSIIISSKNSVYISSTHLNIFSYCLYQHKDLRRSENNTKMSNASMSTKKNPTHF